MALAPGDRVGPYAIVASIGKGGMGEVFRARDPRVDRDVAIKVSAQKFGERFEREAKAIAALNHPNICHLYDVGPDYLVMEYVEGNPPQGPLPLDEALAIARQIADALEAAHEKGIVHRDLKPGNIKITPAGQVKVLDFGLAKNTARTASSDPEQSPTISMAVTQAGMILGTAAYMAPEQARGKNVDKRADIWAFGVVLYELLTGKRLFQGDDLTDTLASVVKIDPDLSAAPARARRLLKKCLEKDPKHRLRDIGDAWDLLESETGVPPVAAVGKAKTRWFWPAAAAVFALIAAGLAVLLLRPTPPPEAIRFQISAPPDGLLPLGTPAPSPDGRTLAYTVIEKDGINRIHLRSLNSTATRALGGTEGAIHPFWSPDGRSLAFVANNIMKRIDIEGGALRELGVVNGGWHGAWSTAGEILLTAPGTLDRVSVQGGGRRTIVSNTDGVTINHPAFLPDNRRFLGRGVIDGTASIVVYDPATRNRSVVVEGADSAPLLAPAPNGRTYLLYLAGSDLVAQEFDPDSATVHGDPAVLVNDIGVVASPQVKPSVGASNTGVLAFQASRGAKQEFTWVDRSGKRLGNVPFQVGAGSIQISPDGRFLAGVLDADLWMVDLTKPGSPTRLTFESRTFTPRWLPDSKRLHIENGQGSFFVVGIDGSGQKKQEDAQASAEGVQRLARDMPDGKVGLVTFGRETKVELLESVSGRSRNATLSPDGRFIAYSSSESGREEVYVQPVPPATGRTKVSTDGGARVQWRKDGKELFYYAPNGATMAVETTLGDTFSAGVPHELFRTVNTLGWTAHPDGQRFLIASYGANPDTPITVVLNWWTEIEQQAH